MRKFFLVNSFIFKTKTPKIRTMLVSGFYGNREFHVPLFSEIYLGLKFKFDAVVSSEIEF